MRPHTVIRLCLAFSVGVPAVGSDLYRPEPTPATEAPQRTRERRRQELKRKRAQTEEAEKKAAPATDDAKPPAPSAAP